MNYPSGQGFYQCPVHGSDTQYDQEPPSEDWETTLALLLEHTIRASDTDDDDPIPLVEADVVLRDNQYFVHAWDVFDAVRTRLRPGDLFRVGHQTFEVLEFIEEPREYWVRPFETTVTDEALEAWLGDTAGSGRA